MRNQWHGLFAQVACLLATLFPIAVTADEAGVSFWLPGQYGSFSAVPSDPGWSFETAYYHASAAASVGISFERGGGIQAGIKSPSDFFMFTPTYAFETRIFGAQAAFGTTICMERTRHQSLQHLVDRGETRYRDLDPMTSLALVIFIRRFH